MAPGLPPQRALALGVPAASSPSPVAPLVRPAAAPAPGEAPPVMALADAPAGLRQQLAGLSLGGSVHGEQAAQRLVIINGQVFHEGDRVQPDLVVEQIRPRSVVLSVRGQRVALPL
ncbi:MAG: hypothetical protein CFE45_06610 [Burkholderiales bacterium PBB5]|nr:MAG: hypothetical protein CFE45_06610 [Burkholderiales bacterium PBB5]